MCKASKAHKLRKCPSWRRASTGWAFSDPVKTLRKYCFPCDSFASPLSQSSQADINQLELTETEKVFAKTAFVWVTHRSKEGWGYRFGGYMMRSKASNNTTISATAPQIVLLSRHTQAWTVHPSVWTWSAHQSHYKHGPRPLQKWIEPLLLPPRSVKWSDKVPPSSLHVSDQSSLNGTI